MESATRPQDVQSGILQTHLINIVHSWHTVLMNIFRQVLTLRRKTEMQSCVGGVGIIDLLNKQSIIKDTNVQAGYLVPKRY
jgi:hypothetical protein